MSKNLIIDYLARIEVQMNSLKDLIGNLDMNHELNYEKIRHQKAQMAASLNNEVVDISSTKYIRDENRIIISAPEIIIGNVDKNGNLIASDGTSKVVIRANLVGLEGVSKDDSTIGVVRTRAPRIHHVAVDPGIDGSENYVGSTSEILSFAKGVEVRCEQNDYCPCQSMSEPVPNGIHLLSPTDINITSTTSCVERKSRLNLRLKEVDDRIASLSKQLNDSDLSVNAIMKKIREHSESKVYKNVDDPYKVALSYVEIDAANRKLESYLIAMLKQVNKFFQLHFQLVELLREKYVIQSQQEELDSMENVPPVSKVQINAPQISMRTVDGDGVFRTDGSIFLRTQALHAYGSDVENNEMQLDTKMKVKFNQVTIDTSKEIIGTDSNKHVFESSGSFNLYSQNVIVEGVNYEKKKDAVDQENKGVNDRSTISLKASKLDFSSLDKEGKNIGEVKINAKKVDVLSYDVTSDKKFKDTNGSCFNLYFQTLNIGEVKFESDKTTFSQNIRMAGEDIRFRSGGFLVNLYTNLEKDDNIGYFHLLKNKELKFASNEGIKMSVNGKDRIVVGSDEITVWPGLEAKTSIATPSITVDNLKVDKSFTSPSTKEGTAINGPAPQAPATSKDEPEDKINSPELKPEDPDLKKKADEATEECNKKIKEWKEKKNLVNKKKREKKVLEKERSGLEKKLSEKIAEKNIYNHNAESSLLTYKIKAEESLLNVKLGKKKTDEQKQREAQDAENARNTIEEWKELANKLQTGEIDPLSNELKTKNNKIDSLKKELDKAREERSQAHKEVKDALKKESEAWEKIPGGPRPKRDGKTYELIP